LDGGPWEVDGSGRPCAELGSGWRSLGDGDRCVFVVRTVAAGTDRREIGMMCWSAGRGGC